MRMLSIVYLTFLLLCPAAPGHAESPQRGGVLNLILQPEPPTLMLGLSRLGPVSFVGSKIYEGLVTFAPDLTPLPALASSWEQSPDGLTYTFHLRKNVRWHDGHPFTSADVVFSFDVYLRKVFARTRRVVERMDSITAPDDHTVVFRLKEPYPALMAIFDVTGGTIVPRHIYQGTSFDRNPANQTPIGTGPFKFEKWERGAYVHLVRNPDYWQPGKPYLDEIYFHILPDAVTRALAFEAGRMDVLRGGDVENFELPRLAALPDVEVSRSGWEFNDPIAFFQLNLARKPLDDVRVRRALAHGIDRNFIIETIFAGYGRVADSPIPSHTKFHDARDVALYPYDPEKAKRLLREAGLVPGPDGVCLDMRLMPLPYGESWQRLAEYVRERLSDLCIRTTIVETDAGGWAQRITTGDFDLTFNFVYMLGDPAMGIYQTYLSTNTHNAGIAANVGSYANPEVDALLEEANRAIDPALRAKLYSRLQTILTGDIPIVWLHEMELPTLYRKKVRNLISTALGTNDTLADVWLAD